LKTKKNALKRFLGKNCKILTQEIDDEKTNVITGVIHSVDNGFIVIESKQGIGCLNIKTIIAIKPRI
jgi:hypothetical protein